MDIVRQGVDLRLKVVITNRSKDSHGQLVALPVLGISFGIKHRIYDEQVFGVWDKQFIAPIQAITTLRVGETLVECMVATTNLLTGGQYEGERDPGKKDVYLRVSLGIPAEWGPISIQGDMQPSVEYRDAFYVVP